MGLHRLTRLVYNYALSIPLEHRSLISVRDLLKRKGCAFKILAQQFSEGMSGAMPVQDFPRPIVEQGLHPLDLAS
jgi:hypothetical protein